MTVFQFFSAQPGLNGRPYGFCFEHDAPTLEALADRLADDGSVVVTKLWTRPLAADTDDRVVVRRERVLIGLAGVASVRIPAVRHLEPPAGWSS